MIKTATVAALCLLVLTGAARANPGWVLQDLNFRTGPGTGHPVIAALPACTQLHVHARHGGWYRVTWRGLAGWVSARHVAGTPDWCGAPPRPRHDARPPSGNSYHYHYHYYGQ